MLIESLQSRSALKEIIQRVCFYLMEYDDKTNYEWLYGIVILHFLNGDVMPFTTYPDKLKGTQLHQKALAGLDERVFRRNKQLQNDST